MRSPSSIVAILLLILAPVSAVAEPSAEPVTVFVTRGVFSGNLNGIAGADALCATAAVNAGYSGSWTAWLSDESTDARDRIPDGEYQLVNGTVVAGSLNDLTDGDGMLDAAISLDENGDPWSQSVWTGTQPDGTLYTDAFEASETCNNWTDGTNDFDAVIGNSGALDGNWTAFGGQAPLTPQLSPCNAFRSLYCFGEPASTGLDREVRVFVTSNLFDGNLVGLIGADGLCDTAAADADLEGEWTAWLSTPDTDARERIADAEYRLLDGTVVATGKADLLDGSLLAPIDLDENLTVVTGTTNVWTGTGAEGTWPQSGTCDGWLSNDGTQTFGGVGRATEMDEGWTRFGGGSNPCDADNRLYCFSELSVTGCTVDADCDDGNFCNGVETCNAGECQAGSGNPCAAGESCNDEIDQCTLLGDGAQVQVFVTSEIFKGNLDGLAGADDQCTAAAAASGLEGDWTAWLSINGTAARDRIADAAYRLLDGTVIATSKTDLLNGTLLAPIDLDENFVKVTFAPEVWTGTGTDGTWPQSGTCNVWSSSDAQFSGLIGTTTSTEADWTAKGGASCPTGNRLYCFSSPQLVAGAVPDGKNTRGTVLTAGKTASTDTFTLSWGNSCNAADVDYAIYEGELGNFTSHVPVSSPNCTTAGATSADVTPLDGNRYFLVVPLSAADFEGSYGTASDNTPRPASSMACATQALEGGCCDLTEDCDDGLFCTGTETCDTGLCLTDSICNQICLEETDECLECLDDTDCDNGLYCDGAEFCVDTVCQPGLGDPCADSPFPVCVEEEDRCTVCIANSDCDDGDPCTVDSCVGEICTNEFVPSFDPVCRGDSPLLELSASCSLGLGDAEVCFGFLQGVDDGQPGGADEVAAVSWCLGWESSDVSFDCTDGDGDGIPDDVSFFVDSGGAAGSVTVFVTRDVYTGEMGGLTGADEICTASATAAGLGGTWTAWLSDSTTDARDRIPDGEYRLVDGITLVADGLEDLVDSTLNNAINQDENGNPWSQNVWTGTQPNGILYTDNFGAFETCNDWTDGTNDFDGVVGNSGAVDGNWTAFGNQAPLDPQLSPCSGFRSLYCFGAPEQPGYASCNPDDAECRLRLAVLDLTQPLDALSDSVLACAHLQVSSAENAVFPLSLADVSASDVEGNSIEVQTVNDDVEYSDCCLADCNDDDVVDIADAVAILQEIEDEDGADSCDTQGVVPYDGVSCCDCNLDELIDLADAVCVVNGIGELACPTVWETDSSTQTAALTDVTDGMAGSRRDDGSTARRGVWARSRAQI
jgi:hypothetical protein